MGGKLGRFGRLGGLVTTAAGENIVGGSAPSFPGIWACHGGANMSHLSAEGVGAILSLIRSGQRVGTF